MRSTSLWTRPSRGPDGFGAGCRVDRESLGAPTLPFPTAACRFVGRLQCGAGVLQGSPGCPLRRSGAGSARQASQIRPRVRDDRSISLIRRTERSRRERPADHVAHPGRALGDLKPAEAHDDPTGCRERSIPASIALELLAVPSVRVPSVALDDDSLDREGKVDLEAEHSAVESGGGSPPRANRSAMTTSRTLSGGLPWTAQASRAARSAATPCRPGRAWRTNALSTAARVTSPSPMTLASAARTASGATWPRSSSVLSGFVTRIPRRDTGRRSFRSRGRWTRIQLGPSRRRRSNTVTSTTGVDASPAASQRYAADRCEATAPGAHRSAARIRCSDVAVLPAGRRHPARR